MVCFKPQIQFVCATPPVGEGRYSIIVARLSNESKEAPMRGAKPLDLLRAYLQAPLTIAARHTRSRARAAFTSALAPVSDGLSPCSFLLLSLQSPRKPADTQTPFHFDIQ